MWSTTIPSPEGAEQAYPSGFAHESTWSRGQAWASTGIHKIGKQAIRLPESVNHIAEYIFTHPCLSEDLIPYWDFDAPEIPDGDVSAAAVAASAGPNPAQRWHAGTPDGRYRPGESRPTIVPHPSGGFLLLHSTGAKSLNSEIDVPLVYADYYYLEALLKIQN